MLPLVTGPNLGRGLLRLLRQAPQHSVRSLLEMKPAEALEIVKSSAKLNEEDTNLLDTVIDMGKNEPKSHELFWSEAKKLI